MLKPITEIDSGTGLTQPPAMVSVRRFRYQLGVVPSTVWRWIQRGWLDQPVNIGGRQYLTADMVQRFLDRAARGEFAGGAKPPSRAAAAGDGQGGPT